MEKYLRLLNPKSISYEADRIDGGMQQLTTQDVMLALSYANLTIMETELFECYFREKTIEGIKESAAIIHTEMVRAGSSQDSQNHATALFVAMVELCKCPANHKVSVRSRAVIAGVSKDRMHRVLNHLIVNFLEQLTVCLNLLSIKISSQF